MPGQSEKQSLDAASVFNFSRQVIADKVKAANAGDIQSARDLDAYYSSRGDQAAARHWDDFLIAKRDPSAILGRSEEIFSRARALDDRDPKKLDLLDQALGLRASVKPGPNTGREKTWINGKEEIMDFGASQEEYSNKIKAERLRISRLQGRAHH